MNILPQNNTAQRQRNRFLGTVVEETGKLTVLKSSFLAHVQGQNEHECSANTYCAPQLMLSYMVLALLSGTQSVETLKHLPIFKKKNIFGPRHALSNKSAMQSMKSGKYCKSELIRK